MKIIAFKMTFLFLFPIWAGADCFPVEWNLPGLGSGCLLAQTFKSKVDDSEFQNWQCTTNTGTKSYLLRLLINQDPTSENRGCRVLFELIEGN